MKTKKFGRKLDLNKKTVVNLNNGKLGNVKGGRPTILTGCTYCCLDTCENCWTKEYYTALGISCDDPT